MLNDIINQIETNCFVIDGIPQFPLQVDVHVGGEQVESLAEAEPDTPEHDAPPTPSDDVPDAGKQPQNNESQVNPSVAMATCSLV